METRRYRLAHYEIIEQSGGELWWRAHAGFGNTRSGRCFIEGRVLFLAPPGADEPGALKNEFMAQLELLPPWEKTKYYCTSYSLHFCAMKPARAPRTVRSSGSILRPSDGLAALASPEVSPPPAGNILGKALRHWQRWIERYSVDNESSE